MFSAIIALLIIPLLMTTNMPKDLKTKLGYLKRGLHGFFQNNFEKPPEIPPALEFSEIGQSVQGKSIRAFKIGHGTSKKLYAFGIHGNEVGTVKLAHYFLDWLSKNASKIKQSTIFIIPCLNPDGYALACRQPEYFQGGKPGRFNANSVDLNRNFDTPDFKSTSTWSFGQNYTEQTEVFCGQSGASEPETKALINFIKHENIPLLFMFHNAGRDVMPNSSALAQNIAQIYADKTGFSLKPAGYWQKLGQTGTAAHWCDLNNIAYIEIEGSTRWGSDWHRQKAALTGNL